MVYLLVGKITKLNAEIIEINQESNEIIKIKKEKGFRRYYYFFFFTFPDNILNEIKYRSHPAWTFGLHSAK